MSAASFSSPRGTGGLRSSGDRRPAPLVRTSLPGRAALGCTASIRGLPFTFFLPSRQSEIPMAFVFLARGELTTQPTEMQNSLHDDQSVKARSYVVNYNSHAFRKLLQAA